jgi:hypothetical protein
VAAIQRAAPAREICTGEVLLKEVENLSIVTALLS